MNASRKYNRSLHAQISLGTTSDDRFMPNGYVKQFAEMEQLVLTEKLDGQNNCFNKYGVFARSHTSPSIHPWDKPLRQRWELIKSDLKDLEIFGENMYAIHSVGYQKLESYFYVFAVREKDQWLSWEEVKFYASVLDFPTVPEILIQKQLSEFYQENKNENDCLISWLTHNLEMPWEAYVETKGKLTGYNAFTNQAACEGFVIRNARGFKTNEGLLPVAENEFDSLFKLVRAGHVQNDVHWTKNWKTAKLIDYGKHKWDAYQYLSS